MVKGAKSRTSSSVGGRCNIFLVSVAAIFMAGAALAAGVLGGVVALVEWQNKKAAQETHDAFANSGFGDPILSSYDTQVKKHQTNMAIGAVVGVLGIGGAVFVYKF